ncbi:exportin-4 protein [Arabidopsis thaliana]|uniref:Exportin-4 protein n=1 Tax=Arabidopsis thaliana TaxID=3702 RepID=A0A1I9LMZ0_ARATH|nr:exportin-4 protein [Arabidopsis thaliana]NP_001326008.1 exportin-4 protein [Arabidopsis thaliana]ANM63947.1 exportin-4 protein [Arabidopsis thaliana]ANM63948.1 exportin-4 protein [Arabidopsis thaliana]|eukprot:NP_001326007.1 exportin-4 protein [Arabidopsis thaliana]
MQHASSSEEYVLSKVSSVAAQLMKRGWLEFTPAQKEVFFLSGIYIVCNFSDFHF